MSDDNFDDGLVHCHAWNRATEPKAEKIDHPIADASSARTPSTVQHDDHHVMPD